MQVWATGVGIISSIGGDCKATLESLKHSRSGIGKIKHLKTMHNLPVGEIDMDYDELLRCAGLPQNTIAVRTPLIGLIAARQAVAQADIVDCKKYKIAFVSGTTVGGMDRMEQFYDHFLNDNTKNSYLYPHDIGDSSDFIASNIGIFSFVTSISTACSSAATAIIFGAELIKHGKADIAVCGGCESLSLYHLNGFNSLKILDSNPCRPFDISRAGLNLGEGAGYVVLENSDVAKARGAEPLCRLSGYGNACDAYHQTATSDNAQGPYLAMSKALKLAHLKHSEISCVNAHGTGTSNNDLTECVALKRIFGNDVPPFSSTKAFTGHATSAAGGIEAVISILCLQNNFLPANLRFKSIDSALGLMPSIEPMDIYCENIMTNSFGFGGNDTSLIFSKI